MKKDIDLSIIIVNFNTKDLLEACLMAIYRSDLGKYTTEVIVVDNASGDGSVEKAKRLSVSLAGNIKNFEVIQNKENRGFAAANNQGIDLARGRYVLLLNSDTEVEENTLGKMIDFMDHHGQAGVSTCKLILSNGSLDPACHRGYPTPWAALTYLLGFERLFPTSKLFGQYHLGYKDLSKVHEIDSPSGAFFLIRKKAIEEVGKLDQDYFMYAEDLDWSYRLKQKGWKIFFNPEVWTLHRKKQSGRANNNPEVRLQTKRYFYATMKLFYQKHYQSRYGWLMTQTVLLGIKFFSLL